MDDKIVQHIATRYTVKSVLRDHLNQVQFYDRENGVKKIKSIFFFIMSAYNVQINYVAMVTSCHTISPLVLLQSAVLAVIQEQLLEQLSP
jgi:hypothetical protein